MMTNRIAHFPPEIEALPDFDGPFDAHRLGADGCEVLFATYPAGTTIAPHTHRTDNVGVITKGQLVLTVDGPDGDSVTSYGPGDWYHVPAETEHAARFDTDSAEIEFWFDR
jgi:quercetin dioxygenase-like cupin family protein